MLFFFLSLFKPGLITPKTPLGGNPDPPAAVSGPSIIPFCTLESTSDVTPGEGRRGGSPLTACHSPAAQRCVGHSGRWQSRCAGGRPVGSHSASSAAFGVPPWQWTARRWTPRPQDTEHWRKGQKVSGGPRRSRHGKFSGFALCSGLDGSGSDALTPAFKLPGEAFHRTRGKFCKGRAEIPAPLKPAGSFCRWLQRGREFPDRIYIAKNLWRKRQR